MFNGFVSFVCQELVVRHWTLFDNRLDDNIEAVNNVRLIDVRKTYHLYPEMLRYCKHRHKNVFRGCCSEGVIENQRASQILVANTSKISARVIHQRQNDREVDNKLFRTGVVDLRLLPRTIKIIQLMFQ